MLSKADASGALGQGMTDSKASLRRKKGKAAEGGTTTAKGAADAAGLQQDEGAQNGLHAAEAPSPSASSRDSDGTAGAAGRHPSAKQQQRSPQQHGGLWPSAPAWLWQAAAMVAIAVATTVLTGQQMQLLHITML